MPAQLKEELKPRLVPLLAAKGHPDLFEKIADENSAATIEDLTAFLARVGHPALTMKPLM